MSSHRPFCAGNVVTHLVLARFHTASEAAAKAAEDPNRWFSFHESLLSNLGMTDLPARPVRVDDLIVSPRYGGEPRKVLRTYRSREGGLRVDVAVGFSWVSVEISSAVVHENGAAIDADGTLTLSEPLVGVVRLQELIGRWGSRETIEPGPSLSEQVSMAEEILFLRAGHQACRASVVAEVVAWLREGVSKTELGDHRDQILAEPCEALADDIAARFGGAEKKS